MKKNSTVIGMAANLITSEGILEKENLMKSLLSGDIQSIIENFSASKNSIVDLRSENASSDDLINKIINGEQGLNFGASSTIERVILNNQNGLIIQGKVAGVSSWFSPYSPSAVKASSLSTSTSFMFSSSSSSAA